jgi:GNAT superfamily N-acetyltransferase
MKPYTIRPATPDDARSINLHLRRISEEPNNMISYSRGEFVRTVEGERERIEGAISSDNSHMLVAVVGTEIIGMCACFGGVGVRRYTTGLGITVHPAWRNQGVGTALLEEMISQALAQKCSDRITLVDLAYPTLIRRLFAESGS